MSAIINGAVKLEQDDVVLFSDFEASGEMWSGHGPRVTVLPQTFRSAFRNAPIVHCGLSMWDIDTTSNARVDIRAENITTEGFDLVFRTWADTKIARVRANWLAIGETDHSDNWDVY